MIEYTVNSLNDLFKAVKNTDVTLERKKGLKFEVLLFRGHSRKSYELIPAIGRNHINACDISLFREERNLIELAEYKMPGVFKRDLSPVDLLALLQHYGIPTRLLDNTENPLVALFFACCKDEEDGEVIAFKNNEMDVTNYPIINAIAESYKYATETNCSLALFYRAVKEQSYFLEHKLKDEICNRSVEDGVQWIIECCEKPIFVYSTNMSERQKMQQGRYILFPNSICSSEDTGDISFISKIDPIEKNDECIAARYIIPKDKKKELISDLKLIGISKEKLFCDSIDTMCSEIVEDCKRRVLEG